jgi:hypothetical protein
MTVFAGVRKLVGTTVSTLIELSTTTANNGSFGIYAPRFISNVDSYGAISKGTAAADFQISGTASNSPNTSVLTLTTDIAGDSAILRANGALAATSAVDQGTGNYVNAALYIGRRGGTTLPFNGNLYSLIIRGAQSSASQIVSAESYVNSKTGAY